MNKTKLIYWITTSIISTTVVFSGYLYLTSPQMGSAITGLGFPDYFRIQLGLCKIVGGLLLILPISNVAVKVFCYAGLAISFVSAFVAHYSMKDPLIALIFPLAFLLLLVASFYSFRNLIKNGAV
jgi:hypothetical protein